MFSIYKMVPHLTKQLFENCERTMPTLPNAILKSVNNVYTKEVEEWSPSSHNMESQERLPTVSHYNHLLAPFHQRLMKHLKTKNV